MQTEKEKIFREILLKKEKAEVNITSVTEIPDGAQGASGSEVKYYEVTYKNAQGSILTKKFVTKNARLFERQVLSLLQSQRQAIPPMHIPAVPDERGLVYMEYAEPLPENPGHGQSLAKDIARALAKIHIENIGKKPEWLPAAALNFTKELYLEAWQREWDKNKVYPEFMAEFGPYKERLDQSMQRLLQCLHAWKDVSTLVMTDLIPGDIRLIEGYPCLIDWEQAKYAPFYVDLPNHYTLETVLTYRDALEELGLNIPPAEFMENFHESGRYMGLRYLEVGLMHWRDRGPDWPSRRWFLYYCLQLALHGR